MISSQDFRINRSQILEQFQNEYVVSDIHTLETSDAHFSTVYILEHHNVVSSTPILDYAQLCKHLILAKPDDDEASANDLPSYLMEQFGALNSDWNTRLLSVEDVGRMLDIVNGCALTMTGVEQAASWQSGRTVGYYLNDIRLGRDYPAPVVSKMSDMRGGLVLVDGGSNLMCLGTVGGKMVLYYWVTAV